MPSNACLLSIGTVTFTYAPHRAAQTILTSTLRSRFRTVACHLDISQKFRLFLNAYHIW